MAYIAFKTAQYDAMDPADRKVLSRAMKTVSLGEPATYENPAQVQWYVWSSLLLTLDDMTLLGSTVTLLASPEGFPYEKSLQIYRDQDPNEQDFLWGVLAGAEAPLLFEEDLVIPPEADPYEFVYDANTLGAAYTQAGTEIPADWEQIDPPPEATAQNIYGVATWPEVTEAFLGAMLKAELQQIADDWDIPYTGTGAGGSVLKSDLVTAHLDFVALQ